MNKGPDDPRKAANVRLAFSDEEQRSESEEAKTIPDELLGRFREKAEAGDGSYAIAYALLRVASAVDRAGLNNEQPDGPPGALAMLAIEVGDGLRALANRDR